MQRIGFLLIIYLICNVNFRFSSMANIIEIIRKQAIEDMFSRESIIGAWEIWHPHIMRFLIGHVDASTILGIGDHLSEIFRTTGTEGRAQGDLAGG